MRPYFEALKSIGYTGGVSCEPGKGGWGDPADLAKNMEMTLNRSPDRLNATRGRLNAP